MCLQTKKSWKVKTWYSWRFTCVYQCPVTPSSFPYLIWGISIDSSATVGEFPKVLELQLVISQTQPVHMWLAAVGSPVHWCVPCDNRSYHCIVPNSGLFKETMHVTLNCQCSFWRFYRWLFTTKQLDFYQVLIGLIHPRGEQGCLLQMLRIFEGWIMIHHDSSLVSML